MQMVSKNLFAKVLFLTMLTVLLGGLVAAQAVTDVDSVVQRTIDARAVPAAGVYPPKVATELAKQKAIRNAPAIADEDPETTKFLRGVFEGIGNPVATTGSD